MQFLGALCYSFHVLSIKLFISLTRFELDMALVPVDRLPLQQLLAPLICADRQLCILYECLTQLQDASDHVDSPGALHSLQLTVQHLEHTIHLVKINRLLHLVRFQQALHLQFRQHGVVPPIDWDRDV